MLLEFQLISTGLTTSGFFNQVDVEISSAFKKTDSRLIRIKNILIADSPEDFSNQVIKILKSKEVHDQLSSNGKQFFKNALPFTNDMIGAELQLGCW